MKLQLLFLQLQNKTFYLSRKAPGARLLLGESPGKSKRLQLLESSEPPGAYDYSVFIVFHKPNRPQTTSFKSFKSPRKLLSRAFNSQEASFQSFQSFEKKSFLGILNILKFALLKYKSDWKSTIIHRESIRNPLKIDWKTASWGSWTFWNLLS